MKKFNFKLYIEVGLIIAVACILTLSALTLFSIKLTDALNINYMEPYMNGEAGFISPWYEDGLHMVDEYFLEEVDNIQDSRNVIVYGSSVSAISIDKQKLSPEDGYRYEFLVCGNGCHRSNRIMDNLVRTKHSYTKDDIVKYEISFSTFRSMDNSITETVINKWKKYSVDKESLEVTENTPLGAPLYLLNKNLIKIQNSWELFDSWRKQIGDPQPKAVGNFKNYYFTYTTVAADCCMEDYMQENVERQLQELNNDATLLVELAPTPPGLQATDYGVILNDYIDNRLIPMMEENNIRYTDLRNIFPDEKFGDGVHLGYEAKEEYTQIINDTVNDIILNK